MPRVTPAFNSVQSSTESMPPLTAVAPLQLRVIGTQRHGHVVEIATPRCTLGSAPDCTVRLRATGVRPIHCVILRGRDGLVVRSLSADTFLNGRIFREQSLRAGDRLRLGPLEFEVLGDSTPPVSRPDESEHARPVPLTAPPDVPVWTKGDAARPSDILSRLQRLEQQLLESPPLLDAASSDAIAASSQLDGTTPPTSAAEEALVAKTAELEQLQQLFAERTAELDAIRQQHEQRAVELETLKQQLVERTNDFENYQQQFDRRTIEVEELEQQLDARTNELAVLQQKFDEQTSELATLQRQLDERTGELASLQEQRDQLASELVSLQQQDEQRLSTWELSRQSLQTELEMLRSEYERQQREMAERGTTLQTEIAQLTAELQSERQNFESARRAWTNDCETLENQRRSLSQHNTDVEQRSRDEFIKYDLERENWLTERQGLEQLLEDFRNRNSELELEAKLLTEQYHKVAEKLERLESQPAANPLAAETVTGLVITERSEPPPPGLWVGSGKHLQQGRSELNWMAQLAAAQVGDQETERRVELVPPAIDEAVALREPETTSFVGPPPAVDEVREFVTEEPAPETQDDLAASTPQFAVRFLPNWQSPPELNESLPLYQPPSSVEPSNAWHSNDTNDLAGDSTGSDVINRLQRAGIWRDQSELGEEGSFAQPLAAETPPAAEPDSYETQLTGELVAPYEVEAPASVAAEGPLAATLPAAASSVEVEDSIESYMQRLLQRVRGSDAPPGTTPTYAFPVEDRSPISEEASVDEAPVVEEKVETPVIEEKEYIPRSQAPELKVDLGAMRELANDNRQRNMMSHAHRTWSAESAGKLLSAFAGFTVAFASYFLRDIHPKLAAIGFMGGISAGLLCLWQAFSLRRRLFDSLKLDVEHRATNEAGQAHSATPEAPVTDLSHDEVRQ